jgi:hypothetical protein
MQVLHFISDASKQAIRSRESLAWELAAIKPMSKSSAVSLQLKLMLLVMLSFLQHQTDSGTMIGLYSILLITPRKLI